MALLQGDDSISLERVKLFAVALAHMGEISGWQRRQANTSTGRIIQRRSRAGSISANYGAEGEIHYHIFVFK
jgi:hypothetical protein